MNAPAREREAALLLYSLPPQARNEVFRRLTSAERARVEPLVAELTVLGIPRLPPKHLGSLREDRPRKNCRERLRELPNTTLLAALREAGPAVLAQLLRLEDWPWKSGLLAGMDAPRRTRTLELCVAAGNAPVAPAVADGLCRLVLDQVDGQDEHASKASKDRRRRWTRWFPWIR